LSSSSTVQVDLVRKSGDVAVSPKILIVDNEPSILLVLSEALGNLEAEIFRAEDGEEALKLVQANDFSVILLDVSMPGMDGFQVAAHVRNLEKGKSVPIIFLSAIHKEPDLVFKGYQSGAVDYQIKPINLKILNSKVQVFLELFRSRCEIENNVKLLSKMNVSLHQTKDVLEQTLKTLKQEKEHFESIFDHSNDAILIVDADKDTILNANEKACSFLQYSENEILKLSPSDIYPYDTKKMKSLYGRLTQADSDRGQIDMVTCLTKAGVPVLMEASVSKFSCSNPNGPLFDNPRLLVVLHNITERERLREQSRSSSSDDVIDTNFDFIVGSSEKLKNVLVQVKMVGRTDSSVLIVGESGTGKELIAKAIHEVSPRKDKPFVRVNCASIPTELFESEFFGHVKGAFTGAIRDRIGRFDLAQDGTLFLDEVGEIPLSCQAKLLRVLQDHEFERVGEGRSRKSNARIVAATNRNLLEEVAGKRFREDLYYRLSVFPIVIPPLRNRVEDIEPLARHFFEKSCKRLNLSPMRLTHAQLSHLMQYGWPGNIRELQHAIERAVILGNQGELVFEGFHLPKVEPEVAEEIEPISEGNTSIDRQTLASMERKQITEVLESVNFQKGKAARVLGIDRATLYRKSKKYGISTP
jgi:PAS domain S-box-containing protein